MNAVSQLGVIVLVSLAAAGATWLVKGPPSEPAAFVCDPAQLTEGEICLADVSGNVLWVDARTRSEWKRNGLEGAILWNLDPKEDENAMEAGVAMGIDLIFGQRRFCLWRRGLRLVLIVTVERTIQLHASVKRIRITRRVT